MFPEDTYAVEGSEVKFAVRVRGLPQPTVTWYHNHTEIVSDDYRIIKDDGTLFIPCVERVHGGVYQLVVTNTVGRVEREVNLSLRKEGVYQQLGHQFSFIPVVDFGEYVTKCHASNNSDFRDQFTVSVHFYKRL